MADPASADRPCGPCSVNDHMACQGCDCPYCADLREPAPADRRPKPRIVISPGRMGGQPTVGDSRIPADLVAGAYWQHGMGEAETQWEPYVDRWGVLLACWYMGRYGTRTWRKRLADWIEEADYRLWHGDDDKWDNCPDPPTVAEAARDYDRTARALYGQEATVPASLGVSATRALATNDDPSVALCTLAGDATAGHDYRPHTYERWGKQHTSWRCVWCHVVACGDFDEPDPCWLPYHHGTAHRSRAGVTWPLGGSRAR